VIAEVERNYYGQHVGKSDAHHLEEFSKGLYGLAIVYPVALSLSKLSLLALYWRIFAGTKGRLPIQVAAALNIGWMLAAVYIDFTLFQRLKTICLTAATVFCRNLQLYTGSGFLGHECPEQVYQL